jgi:hypothetical protein
VRQALYPQPPNVFNTKANNTQTLRACKCPLTITQVSDPPKPAITLNVDHIFLTVKLQGKVCKDNVIFLIEFIKLYIPDECPVFNSNLVEATQSSVNYKKISEKMKKD